MSKQAREGWQRLALQTQALQDGYLQVSLVNYSQQAVYFDDGQISHAGPSTAKFRMAGPVSKPDSLPPEVGSTPTAATSQEGGGKASDSGSKNDPSSQRKVTKAIVATARWKW